MNHIARALLQVAAFLEFSEDDELDPDSAVKAMEDIAAELAAVSATERTALSEAAIAMAAECRASGPGYEAVAEFYDKFIEDFNVGGDQPR